MKIFVKQKKLVKIFLLAFCLFVFSISTVASAALTNILEIEIVGDYPTGSYAQVSVAGQNLLPENCFSLTDCIYKVPDGEDVALVPVNASDAKFSKWGGDCFGIDNECYLYEMNSDKNVSVFFTKVVSIPNNGGNTGGGNNSGGGGNTGGGGGNVTVPFGGGGLVPDCVIDPVTKACVWGWDQLMGLVNNIVNFVLFVLAVPIAAIMFAYAGILLLTSGGDSAKKTKAKDLFVGVVKGLVIASAAWLIVHTILSILGYAGSWIGF
ncbi:MAG: pilin [Patescibacteria group bacterium]